MIVEPGDFIVAKNQEKGDFYRVRKQEFLETRDWY